MVARVFRVVVKSKSLGMALRRVYTKDNNNND